MDSALSVRHTWVQRAWAEYREAIRSDNETATIKLLCCLLSDEVSDVDSGSGGLFSEATGGVRTVPVLLLGCIVSELRRRLSPHSTSSSSQRAYEWDVTCAYVLQSCICPGVFRSTWERWIKDVILSDWNMSGDGTGGIVAKIYNEAIGIFEAVSSNSVYQLRRKLQSNILDVNMLHQRDEFGWSLLHHASYGNCVDTIRYLISEGLSPNITNRDGATPLHVAAAGLHIDAITLLIQSGAAASISVQDIRGETPIELYLKTASLSCWQFRMSPAQLADTALLMLRDPMRDIWRVRPPIPSSVSSDKKHHGISIFIRLLWISDASVAQTVVAYAVQSLKEMSRNHNSELGTVVGDVERPVASLWPISDLIKAGISRQQANRSGSSEEQKESSVRDMTREEYDSFFASIKAQVRVAVALSLKRKRVRILKLLLQIFDPLLDLFESKTDSVDLSGSLSGSDVGVKHHFFFQLLELAVVTKSLRTVVVLMDWGKDRDFFSFSGGAAEVSVQSCFLNLVISQSDPLLLRLVLERLGASMDTWVTLPPNYNLSSADDISIVDPSKNSSDSEGDFGEMTLFSAASLLRRTLNLGLMDKQNFFMRLAIFSPISLSCLLNDHVSLDTILSRMDRSLGEYLALNQNGKQNRNSILSLGCSPLVCCALAGATDALSVLKGNLGSELFFKACSTEDAYGLTGLKSLMHVLRLQHDQVGQGSLWPNLASIVRDDVSRNLDSNAIFSISKTAESSFSSPLRSERQLGVKEGIDVTTSPPLRSASLGSPVVNDLLLRSGSGMVRSTSGLEHEVSGTPSKASKNIQRNHSGDSLYSTPVKKHKLETPSKSASRRKHSTASARKAREHQDKIAEYRRLRKQNGDLHTDFGGGMFNMSGLRYGRKELELLLDLLTPAIVSPELGAKELRQQQNLQMNVQIIRERLVFLCGHLQRLAFSNGHNNAQNSDAASEVVNVRILRPGERYRHLSSGNVQISLQERTVILLSAETPEFLSGDDSSLPQGYLVEDIMSNLLKLFPSVSEVLELRRQRRSRWYSRLRLDRESVLRDLAVTSHSPLIRLINSDPICTKSEEINLESDTSKNDTSEELFRSILSTYTDAPFYADTTSAVQTETVLPVATWSLRSQTFLRKMKLLTNFMAESFSPPKIAQQDVLNSQEPRIKPDRTWALLGQCVWLLLDSDSCHGPTCTAEVSWKNIQKKLKQSNGSVVARALERASGEYVSYEQFVAAMKIVDPTGSDKYKIDSGSRSSPPTGSSAIRAFSARVLNSVSKHGLWVRDRFGLCLTTLTQWVELVLIDVDAVISSPNLNDNFNRDGSPMIFRDSAVNESAGLPAPDVITYLEEALYIDSLLVRANKTDNSSKVPGHIPNVSEVKADLGSVYQRDALATLLNASYAPLPHTLPAVICAIGYIMREFVNLGLVGSCHNNALRLGVSPDTGIGVCGHVGCGDYLAKTRPARDVNVILSVREPEVIKISGNSRVDEFPSVLFELAASTLTNKFIRVANEMTLVTQSGGSKYLGRNFLDVVVVDSLCYPMSSSASIGIDNHITQATRHMSPLLCLAGRKLWGVVQIILDDKLSACDAGQLQSSRSQDLFYEEVYLCPRSAESINNPAPCTEESTVQVISNALRNNFRGLDIRRRLEGYFAVTCNKTGDNTTITSSHRQGAVCNYEFVGFLDFCLINEAPVDMMVQYLRYKVPAGRSLSYLDLTDMMLCAIQRRRYEVCFELLSFVAGQEANIQMSSDDNATGSEYPLKINRGSSTEQRDWAVQIAYIMFRTHLDSEYGYALTSARIFPSSCSADGRIKSSWYLPLLSNGEPSSQGINLRKNLLVKGDCGVVTNFTGPLSGLCQDRKSGGIIMRDGSILPLRTLRENFSLLQWAMPPACVSTGLQTSTGHSLFHTLLSLGVEQLPVLDKLIKTMAGRVSSESEPPQIKTGASIASIGNMSGFEPAKNLTVSLQRSLLGCNKSGVSPVHLALLCKKTDVIRLRKVLIESIDLKSEISPVPSLYTVRVNSKVAEPVHIEDLFRTVAEENLKEMQLLQASIENPMRPDGENNFKINISGNLISHHQCCLLNALSRLLNRVENHWRKLCRADFRPLMRCLYGSSGNSQSLAASSPAMTMAMCPYNSVHRAKAILLALKIPFSTLNEGSHRKIGDQNDLSMTGLDFSELTPRKLSAAVSLKTAHDIKSWLCEWTRARSDKKGDQTVLATTNGIHRGAAAVQLLKRRLEEAMVVTRFVDIPLTTIGELGSLEGLRKSINVMSVTEPENNPFLYDSKNKRADIVDAAGARKSWDSSFVLPDQLLSEMKQLHSRDAIRNVRTAAAENSLMHVTDVVSAWTHRRQEISDVLRLAYEILDLGRYVAVCRLLCSATNIGLSSPIPEMLHYEDDDDAVLEPAHKPQLPFIVKKDMRKRERLQRLRNSENQSRLDCSDASDDALPSSDESEEEHMLQHKPIEQRKDIFVNALEAIMAASFSANHYSKYLSNVNNRRTLQVCFGVNVPLFPTWSRTLAINPFEGLGVSENAVSLSGQWLDTVSKDYRDVVEKLYRYYIPKSPGQSPTWWLSAVGLAEYLSVYSLLSLKTSATTSRLFRLRQRFLRSLSILSQALGNFRLCEYVCRILRSFSEKENLVGDAEETVTPENSNPLHNLIISDSEAAFAIVEFVHSLCIKDILILAENASNVDKTGNDKSSFGVKSISSLYTQLRKSMRAMFCSCESSYKAEAGSRSLSEHSSATIIRSLVRAEDDSIPRMRVATVSFDDYSELLCDMNFVNALLEAKASSSENNAERTAGDILNRAKYTQQMESVVCASGAIGSCSGSELLIRQCVPLDSEMNMFRKSVTPQLPGTVGKNTEKRDLIRVDGSITLEATGSKAPSLSRQSNSTYGAISGQANAGAPKLSSAPLERGKERQNVSSAMRAASKAVVQRAEQRIYVAYSGITVLHNFFRCVNGILSHRSYYETDPQLWGECITPSLYQNGLSIAALRLIPMTNIVSVHSKEYDELENAVMEITELLLTQDSRGLALFRKSIEYPNLHNMASKVDISSSSSSSDSDKTVDEGVLASETNREMKQMKTEDDFYGDMSPLFVSALNGSYKLLQLYLHNCDPSILRGLLGAPCHRYLVWHMLMEAPSISLDDRSKTNVCLRREHFENAIQLLLSLGFSADHPDGSQLSCLFLACLKQFSKVSTALFSCECPPEESNTPHQRFLNLKALHLSILAPTLPASLVADAMIALNTTSKYLSFSGDIVCPGGTFDAFLHTRAISEYAKSCCSCEDKNMCKCRCRNYNCADAEKRHRNFTLNALARSYVNLQSPLNRNSRCPIYRFLRAASGQLLEDIELDEISGQAPFPSLIATPVIECRESIKLCWSGLHLALASGDVDKFLAVIGLKTDLPSFLESIFDPEKSSGEVRLNWLCIAPPGGKNDHYESDGNISSTALVQLMHLACFYDNFAAVSILAKSSFLCNKDDCIAVGSEVPTPHEMQFLDPSCCLSLFFEPLNMTCSPLQVSIRTGHAKCAQVCLDAHKYCMTYMPDVESKQSPLAWDDISTCVYSGVGGDRMSELLLNYMYASTPPCPLWENLRRSETSGPVFTTAGESILHVAVRRGYARFVRVACEIYRSCIAQLESSSDITNDANIYSVTDSRGLNLLQASVASGHREITFILGPLFSREVKAITVITLSLRKILLRRYLRRRQSALLKKNSQSGM